MLSKKLLDTIGFNYIIDQLNIITPYGKDYLKNLSPILKSSGPIGIRNLEKRYDVSDLMARFISDKYGEIKSLLNHIKDIKLIIKNCISNPILSTVEFYELKNQAIIFERLKEIFNTFKYKDLHLETLEEVIKILNPQEIITNDFYIYNEYSHDLKVLRDQKNEVEAKYFIEDDTTKLEQLEEIRNALVVKEKQLEHDLRKVLCNKVKPYMNAFLTNINVIGRIDFIIAKVKLNERYFGIRPTFVSDTVELKKANNPYISDSVHMLGRDYTLISIDLSLGLSLITGANMGGKSSTLKTILLNIVLAHYGLYVYAESARIMLFDYMFYNYNEGASLENGLSSFGQEIINLNSVLDSINSELTGLIVIDEFAQTTNPEEGRRFVKALNQYLHTQNAISIVATHYDDVLNPGMTHYQVKGIKHELLTTLDYQNFNQQVSEYMDYSLEKTNQIRKVPKQALEIAKILKLNPKFIKILETQYKED